MLKLLEDENFQSLIMDGFIKKGILTTALEHNLASEAVLDALKARQELHRYILDIINQSDD